MTFQPRVWLNGLLPPLRPIEALVFNAWLTRVDPATREIASRQIGLYNLAQRFANDREVNLHFVRAGLIKMDVPGRLPHDAREALLATVELEVAGRQMDAEIWAANGRVFSIVFSEPPPAQFEESAARVINVRVQSSLGQKTRVPNLPRDYNAVLQRDQSGPQRSDTVVLLKPDEIYEVHSYSQDFWALAEVADTGMLAVRRDRADGHVWLLTYDGAAPRELAQSLAEAVVEVSGDVAS